MQNVTAGTATPDEIKNILLALKVLTASVGSIGIVSTIVGVMNRKRER